MLTLGIIIFIIGYCMSSYEDNAYNTCRREAQRHEELMRVLDENRKSAPQVTRRKEVVRR